MTKKKNKIDYQDWTRTHLSGLNGYANWNWKFTKMYNYFKTWNSAIWSEESVSII